MIGGYALTMAAVPAMAFAFNWQTAALFVVLERTGKAIRSPATNTMQSRAGDLLALLRRGDQDAFDDKVHLYQGYPP